MRNLLIIAILFATLNLTAQIKGNETFVTSSIDISNFKSLYLGLYAEYEVDLSKGPSLEITIDENLIQHVEKSVKNGELIINQKKWIQASAPVKITVGAKGMKSFTQSSHSRTYIRNIDLDQLKVNAEVGDVFLEGKVSDLDVIVSTATVDASALSAKNGKFKFESWGKVIANVSGEVSTDNSTNGKLILNGEREKEKVENNEIRFIKFVIRNNSANRHQFYVVGPKADGSSFSYGFPMMPYQKRDKNWTNGTQVYKVNNLGLRKLVKTIELKDEGQTVDIFE
jgi:hypothetical protein